MFSNTIKFTLMGFFLLFAGTKIYSQDLLYFCEKYTDKEVGVGDRFTTGTLTVMVKLEQPIYYSNVTIEWDRINCDSGDFEYADSKNFTVDSKWTYMFFDGIKFTSPGIYRVFLLDPDKETIVSGLIEIIGK
jgi:hypothetical protein